MDRKRDYIRGAAVFYGFAKIDDIRTDLPLLYVRSGLDSTGLNRELDATVAAHDCRECAVDDRELRRRPARIRGAE
jgi:hypothetical protein